MSPSGSEDEWGRRPPLLHCMLAGGIGGTTGDFLMHSLDTVKTRQQGDPHIPPKYTTLGSSYYKIWRQEGIIRGLYGGWLPAIMGSFPATVFFFGSYELTKRFLLDHGVQAHVSYLAAGVVGDLAASVPYVPSEVLKTRLQLQGRYNNPHFKSGYNYRGTWDAIRTIVKQEGAGSLLHGYRATLYRDVPFSALQLMFYEQFQWWAKQWHQSQDIGTGLEVLTGAAGGGLAGVLTCPLDVVKTRLQTQVHSEVNSLPAAKALLAELHTTQVSDASSSTLKPPHITVGKADQLRAASSSTQSASCHLQSAEAAILETSSVFKGLKIIYKTEGIAGWFRGVGPRGVWTSIQSGCMFFLYQTTLRKLEAWFPNNEVIL